MRFVLSWSYKIIRLMSKPGAAMIFKGREDVGLCSWGAVISVDIISLRGGQGVS